MNKNRYFVMYISDGSSENGESEDSFGESSLDDFIILKTDSTGKQLSLRSSSDPNKNLRLTKKAKKWDINEFDEISKQTANNMLKEVYAKTKR